MSERKKIVKDKAVSDLSNWRDGVAVNWDGRITGKRRRGNAWKWRNLI